MNNLEVVDIEKIEFGILSPEEIRTMAVCKIDQPYKGEKENGTIYDKRMGCIMDTNKNCVTCGFKEECWGHFGYIELTEPIIHPMFHKIISCFLKCFCKQCYRLLFSEEQIILSGLHKYKTEKRFGKILEKINKIDICSHCSQPQPKILYKSLDKTISMEYKSKKTGAKISIILEIDKIKEIFDNICESDIRLLGFDPHRIHPKNLIITNLAILPPCSRPYFITDGKMCDDDLTYQISEIVKVNNQLQNVSEQKRQKLIQTLRFRISTTMDNSKGKAKHPTDSRPIKGLKERLTGKDGRLRSNLMGKRVDFSARTVIGAEPTLKLGQVGIPFEIARSHTIPEVVTPYNIDRLTHIVNNGHANYVLSHKKCKLCKNEIATVSKEGEPIATHCEHCMSTGMIRNKSTVRITLEYAMGKHGTRLQHGDIIVRGNVTLREDENECIIIPESCSKIEVTVIKKEDINRPISKDDIIVRKNKVIITKKLKIGDTIVRGAQIDKDNVIIPENREAIRVIYNNATLQPGDQLIREGKLFENIQYPCKKPYYLKIGDIVERHLVKGDTVLYNRQPTLHKGSMLAMNVVPLPYKTFRMNLAVCPGFNADFDGDEMNIHTPQSPESEIELQLLSAAKHNIISSQESKPIIVIVQDSLLGAFLMTRYNHRVTRTQFSDICMAGERVDGSSLWNVHKIKTIRKVQKQFRKKLSVLSGRGLISLLLPDNLYYEYQNDAHPLEPVVKIFSGVFIEGALNKSVLGSTHHSLIRILHKEYGVDVTANFIDNIQFITNAWMLMHSFSIGLQDCMVTGEQSIIAIKDTLAQCYTKAQGIEENTTNVGIREVRITAALNQAKDIGMRIAKDAMKPDNNFLASVHSGAKGDFFNIAQITGILGQQNLENQRVVPVLNHGKRTLPHYPFQHTDKEREYESRGFIRHSFIRGLNPEEFYFHAMSGREGICDTAMGTAKSGYIQRKIIKVCEDVQVQYDGTVRDATGRVYQFVYGENGFDTTHTVWVNNEPQICDVSRLVDRLNNVYESNCV